LKEIRFGGEKSVSREQKKGFEREVNAGYETWGAHAHASWHGDKRRAGEGIIGEGEGEGKKLFWRKIKKCQQSRNILHLRPASARKSWAACYYEERA